MELILFSIVFVSLIVICSGIEKASKIGSELSDVLNSIRNLPDIKNDSDGELRGLEAIPQESEET